MIYVTIATNNFRFLYKLNEILANIKNIKTNHILPNEQIPDKTKLIITTEIEKKYFKNKIVFVPKAFNSYYLYSNIILLVNNKESFKEVTVGIDPGKTIGFAVIVDEKRILATGEFFTAVDVVKETIAVFFNVETTKFEIKIGDSGGTIREEIVSRLKEIFHDKGNIQVVSEHRTSKVNSHQKKLEYSKNINSAILIAFRKN
ncbi:MAG: hypothetical protein ACFFDS_03755 [Candidatus Thorarchaeota archaeon]